MKLPMLKFRFINSQKICENKIYDILHEDHQSNYINIVLKHLVWKNRGYFLFQVEILIIAFIY